MDWRLYRVLLFVVFIVCNIIALLLNIADFEYFKIVQRRMMFEPYTMLPDLLKSLPGIVHGHMLLFLLFCIIAIGFILGLRFIILMVEKRFIKKESILRQWIWFAVTIPIAVIGIRGGLQLKPLRQSNAFLTATTSVGYLTLNTTYTVLRSYFQPTLPNYDLLPDEEAREVIRKYVFGCNDSAIDNSFPFLRSQKYTLPLRKWNVVVFIMESWTAESVGSISGTSTVTPFFDSLAIDGMLFTNFLANGQRSIEALPSILTSVPGLYASSLIGSKAEMNMFIGLGTLLRNAGYVTSFHHGAEVGSMGFDAYSRIAGFTHYFSKEDIPNATPDDMNGSWGVNDEPFIMHALQQMNSFPQPFCSVIFSISSHDPYHIPSNRRAKFTQFENEAPFRRSMRYADFSLSQYFHAAKKSAWYDSTIFIITSDHTELSTRNNMHAAFHIPTLIFAPALSIPRKEKHVASQVDILPTILDLLRLPTIHASMGRSIVDTARIPFAVVRFGPHFAIFSDSLVYIHDSEKQFGMFAYNSDPQFRIDLARTRKSEVANLRRMLFGYLQETTKAVANDKIAKR